MNEEIQEMIDEVYSYLNNQSTQQNVLPTSMDMVAEPIRPMSRPLADFFKRIKKGDNRLTQKLIEDFYTIHLVDQDRNKHTRNELVAAKSLLEGKECEYVSPILLKNIDVNTEKIKVYKSLADINKELTPEIDKISLSFLHISEEYTALQNYSEFLTLIRKKTRNETSITKGGFLMKKGTEDVWKRINKFINDNEWAEGDIFFDDDPVRWIEKDGLYTLVEFVERITKYDINDFYKNDLYTSNTKKDDRNVFIVTFFTINGKPINREELKDPRKSETKKRNKRVRREFLEYLEMLIMSLNDKPYSCGYAPIED